MVMFKRESAIEIPAEGFYLAKIKDMADIGRVKTKYGEVDAVNVIFNLESGYQLTQRVLIYPGVNSLAQKLVESTVGEVYEIEFDELIGHNVGVRVVHNRVDGKTYVNVDDIVHADYLESYDEYTEYSEDEEYSCESEEDEEEIYI